MSQVRTVIKLATLAALMSTPAMAHIIFDPAQAPAGSWLKTNLRVTHGCNGEATKRISVTIPGNVTMIKPQVKPGWEIEIHKAALPKPVEGPHGMISEVTDSISWSGGTVPDDMFDDFSLNLLVPREPGYIFLEVTQECTTQTIKWSDYRKEGSPHSEHYPVPVIQILKPKD